MLSKIMPVHKIDGQKINYAEKFDLIYNIIN
jgi:hypothetical protein